MKANERRQQILEMLENSEKTLSASYLAEELGVSRQIIVGDIAILRASKHDILSTPRGYIFNQFLLTNDFKGRIVCQHSNKETQEELEIIIANGGSILTVEIEHPIYGMIVASLNIKTKEDISDFMTKITNAQAELLSSLTNGLHSHLISSPDKESFDKIKKELAKRNILYQNN
ncbi:3H domain-containing protein [Streptococcus hongkongensis]|nr:DNA-binding protein [Streptococcus uberis]